jgi:hypothetical protein
MAAGLASGSLTTALLTIDERAILADQQLEVLAFLAGEFEEDLLAFGILEAIAVAFEEPVGRAFAADANHQCLAIVDALGQLFGARGEQTVGRALEKQEGRTRFEQRVGLQELLVARFELAEMFLLFRSASRANSSSVVPPSTAGVRPVRQASQVP